MQTAPGPPASYVDPAGQFAVTAPPGWWVDTSGAQGSRVIFFCPAADPGFQPNLNVLLQPLGGLTPDEYLTMTRLQLKQMAGPDRLWADQARPGPPPGHVFEWLLPLNPGTLRARQLTVFLPRAALILTATALLPQFEPLRPAFESIFESVRLRTPPGPGAAGG